mmetsp:Transcript_100795/g.315003  ORF Transcript_100795/g.315003 Transcript_100795/m.315003 type:complete len:235 (-) Transcript_100795:522-1226(-)
MATSLFGSGGCPCPLGLQLHLGPLSRSRQHRRSDEGRTDVGRSKAGSRPGSQRGVRPTPWQPSALAQRCHPPTARPRRHRKGRSWMPCRCRRCPPGQLCSWPCRRQARRRFCRTARSRRRVRRRRPSAKPWQRRPRSPAPRRSRGRVWRRTCRCQGARPPPGRPRRCCYPGRCPRHRCGRRRRRRGPRRSLCGRGRDPRCREARQPLQACGIRPHPSGWVHPPCNQSHQQRSHN